ncbi:MULTISPECIES: Uma2 family endonuclease, partial [unclassified Microcoleus]|uniref:Uma2 family endonuclease n=1 Tax=unclassified Microcoleus TaxID=2642155 RepID=UPI002FD5681F
MTIAIDQPIQHKPLSFDEFIARYGGDNRYELIDGEVFDLEPTGPHEEVAAFITTKICVQIDATGLPSFVLQRGLLRPSNIGMTAFRPDVAVVDRDELSKGCISLWRVCQKRVKMKKLVKLPNKD